MSCTECIDLFSFSLAVRVLIHNTPSLKYANAVSWQKQDYICANDERKKMKNMCNANFL